MLSTKRLEKFKKLTLGQIIILFIYLLSFILIIIESDIAIEYMKRGLLLCAKSVVPSLFPFMVISELIVRSGLGNIVGNIFSFPTKKLFGTSRSSSFPVIIGILCGFPIGAKTIVSLLDTGEIDEEEASQLLTFCNNPSSGFVISTIGLSLYSNKRIGIILYAVTIINAILIGIVQNYLNSAKKRNDHHYSKYFKAEPDIFTVSVTNSCNGIISVCGYIVFFSTIVGCISDILEPLDIGSFYLSLLYGFFELSGGVSLSSSIGISTNGICLTAFIIGWSGLSVHFQIMSICSKYNISLKKYFVAKFFHAILNSLIIYFLFKSFPFLFKSATESTVSLTINSNKYIILILLLFLLSILYSYKKHK